MAIPFRPAAPGSRKVARTRSAGAHHPRRADADLRLLGGEADDDRSSGSSYFLALLVMYACHSPMVALRSASKTPAWFGDYLAERTAHGAQDLLEDTLRHRWTKGSPDQKDMIERRDLFTVENAIVANTTYAC